MKIHRMNSIMDHYYENKGEIEDRFKKRLAKMQPTKPITPKLATLARAAAHQSSGIKFGNNRKGTFMLAENEQPTWKGAVKH